MKFLDISFPLSLSAMSVGGVEFSTSVSTLKSKNEVRISNWLEPRGRFNIAASSISDDDFESLKSFFMLCKGRQNSFRFKDLSDYRVDNQFIATSDDERTEYQLKKTYSFNGYSVDKKITKPVDGSIKIYLGETLLEDGFSVDYSTGIISFDTPPDDGVGIYASFEFDLNMRFDTDYLPVQFENFSSMSTREISLVEVI